jgi:hypothetical protein
MADFGAGDGVGLTKIIEESMGSPGRTFQRLLIRRTMTKEKPVELGAVKVVISILTVVALAEIAKRVDPTLSGILLGLPLGAGLAVYFISYEQGVAFLVSGIPWAIAGLASSILFCLAYLLAGLTLRLGRVGQIAGSSAAAALVFFVSGAGIRNMNIDLTVALAMFFAVAAGNILILRRLPLPPAARRIKPLSTPALLLRGLLSGLIILAVTAAAPIAGSRWAGIMSSFPSTLYALLVIIHFETGKELYPMIIRGFGYSVPALVVFYLGCMVALPMFGLNMGFLIVYAVSAAYLYLTHRLIAYLKPAG